MANIVGVLPAAYPLKLSLVSSASILTFPEQSELFGTAQSGWICATNEGVYYGEVSGIYAGGTGRFQAATGDYVSKSDGVYLQPNLSVRSIWRKAEGTVGRK